MPYYVMCRVSDGATGTRESILTRHGIPVAFGTLSSPSYRRSTFRHSRLERSILSGLPAAPGVPD
jgi:hypothetical protein